MLPRSTLAAARAFDRLVQEHYVLAYNTAYRMLGNPDQAAMPAWCIRPEFPVVVPARIQAVVVIAFARPPVRSQEPVMAGQEPYRPPCLIHPQR